MGCFSMAWFQQLFILFIIVAAIVAIFNILVPYVLSKLQPSTEVSEGIGIITRVIRIVVWAIIAIFVIYVCFALIQCLLSYSGGMPLLPRR